MEEQRVLNTGVSRIHTSFEYDDVLGVPDLQYRHTVDRASRVVQGGGIDYVVGADNDHHIGIFQGGVGVFQVQQFRVGDIRFGQQHVHVPRHTAGDGVYSVFHIHTVGFQQIIDLFTYFLRLSHRQAIARDDHDRAGVVKLNGRVVEGNLFGHLPANGPFGSAGRPSAETADEHVEQRAVHGVAHKHRKNGAGGAYQDAAHQHEVVAVDQACGSGGQPRERVEQ